ncbi:MAG: hypothetical protein JWP91_1859 [Fibrobacteres bacterium]|nr:hypothetical protein [Fibrobacterota bacterium]
MTPLARRLAPCCAALLATACTAPRSILYSPEALPKGGYEAGLNYDGNIPTQTSEALYGGLGDGIDALYDKASGNDTAAVKASDLNGYTKALIAYSLDPLQMQAGLFFRYGFWPRFDGGYHRNGGVNAYDLRWQFLGPAAGDTSGGASRPGAWSGSIGVQYSSQSFELPSVAGLDKLQSLLQYSFDRKDLLFPLVLGGPFGDKGRFGGFGLGLAYNLAFIEYDSDIRKLAEQLEDGSTRPFEALHGEKTVSAYGGFANARLGYRWVYLIASLSCYWQDYGTFTLFGGRRESLQGLTLLPSLALELRW